jgi:hypothetical protein
VTDSVKKLTELNSFKKAIYLPLVASVVVAIIIYRNSNLILDCSFNGFNQLLIIYKVPLGILALAFPFVAIVASNHRSVQSKAQINLALNQNELSVKPILCDEIVWNVDKVRGKTYSIKVKNKGLGTAKIINHCVLSGDKKFTFEDLKAWINQNTEMKLEFICSSLEKGQYISKDESIEVFKIQFGSLNLNDDMVVNALRGYLMEIEYECLYENTMSKYSRRLIRNK